MRMLNNRITFSVFICYLSVTELWTFSRVTLYQHTYPLWLIKEREAALIKIVAKGTNRNVEMPASTTDSYTTRSFNPNPLIPQCIDFNLTMKSEPCHQRQRRPCCIHCRNTSERPDIPNRLCTDLFGCLLQRIGALDIDRVCWSACRHLYIFRLC